MISSASPCCIPSAWSVLRLTRAAPLPTSSGRAFATCTCTPVGSASAIAVPSRSREQPTGRVRDGSRHGTSRRRSVAYGPPEPARYPVVMLAAAEGRATMLGLLTLGSTWTVLAAFYLLCAGGFSADEQIAAAAGGLVGTVLSVLIRRDAERRFRLCAPWRVILRPLTDLAPDAARVARVLLSA